MIRVEIDVPYIYRKKAKYIFSIFQNIWGLPIVFVTLSELLDYVDIRYTNRTRNLTADKLINIPFDESLYSKKTQCLSITSQDYLLWLNASTRIFDLVASSYRLLNFFDETHIDSALRNSQGIFSVQSLPKSRRKVADQPLVEHQAEFLLEILLRLKPNLKDLVIPRWPKGKRYAVAVTHDTDSVNIGSPKELFKFTFQSISKRSLPHLYTLMDGLKHLNKIKGNPFLNFSNWIDYEEFNNEKSCFYLSLKPLFVKKSINDCLTVIERGKIDLTSLKIAAKKQWEVGLHCPINSKDDTNEFIYGKQILEEILETPIYGLRHHYWSLDWFNPYLTFKKHIQARYLYDASIAWKGGPGFRAATCLPFQPYDPSENQVLNFYELPTCLVDAHIIKPNFSQLSILRKGFSILETVERFGGVAVLDWHTESFYNKNIYKDYFDIFEILLFKIFKSKDVWLATPYEIIAWWIYRSEKLCS